MEKRLYTLYVGKRGVPAHWSDEARLKTQRKGTRLKRVRIIAGPGKENDEQRG